MEIREDYSKEPVTLYRMEYLDEGIRVVDWLWLTEYELENYLEDKAQAAGLIYRVATPEEEELYDEAYRDGYEVATLTGVENAYDGITFRMDGIDEDGDIKTTKMFQCAECDRNLDFEQEVGTSGEMFLGVLKDDKLWHICYSCAMLQIEIQNIEINFKEEDGSK